MCTRARRGGESEWEQSTHEVSSGVFDRCRKSNTPGVVHVVRLQEPSNALVKVIISVVEELTQRLRNECRQLLELGFGCLDNDSRFACVLVLELGLSELVFGFFEIVGCADVPAAGARGVFTRV